MMSTARSRLLALMAPRDYRANDLALAPEPVSDAEFARPASVAAWVASGASNSLNSLAGERISRDELFAVAANVRARDAIVGTLSTLPLTDVNAAGQVVSNNLLAQPSRGRTLAETMAETVERMLLDGKVYWIVTERDSWDWPSKVVVTQADWVHEADNGTVTVAGKDVAPRDVIRFVSPWAPLLITAAVPTRTAARAIAALRQETEDPAPRGILRPPKNSGLTPEEAEAALDRWIVARRAGRVAGFPDGWEYDPVASAEDRALIVIEERARLDLALVWGIDPASLGVTVPGLSRTYTNKQQELVDRRSQMLPIQAAIEGALSADHVTPRGHKVTLDWTSALKPERGQRFSELKQAADLGLLSDAARIRIAREEGLDQ